MRIMIEIDIDKNKHKDKKMWEIIKNNLDQNMENILEVKKEAFQYIKHQIIPQKNIRIIKTEIPEIDQYIERYAKENKINIIETKINSANKDRKNRNKEVIKMADVIIIITNKKVNTNDKYIENIIKNLYGDNENNNQVSEVETLFADANNRNIKTFVNFINT